MESLRAWVKPPELHLNRCPAPREQFRFTTSPHGTLRTPTSSTPALCHAPRPHGWGGLGTGLSVTCFYYFGFKSLICSPSLTSCFCILKGRLFQYSALTVLGQGLAHECVCWGCAELLGTGRGVTLWNWPLQHICSTRSLRRAVHCSP